ncbi:MAG TPA: PIN domain-containing protein [Planctomycetota bacterium]|nr:PIN domain-containing protein [Planctomycetota bacterium]
MITVLLDTTVASILFDVKHPEHKQGIGFIEGLGETRVFVSVVTLAEIRYGYKLHENVDDNRRQAIEKELSRFPLLDVDKHTAGPYSTLKAALFREYAPRDRKGKVKAKWPEDLLDRTTAKSLGIQENDLWIAAVAVQYNLALVTCDRMNRIVAAIHEVYPDFSLLLLDAKS